jgi:hypothetical protein
MPSQTIFHAFAHYLSCHCTLSFHDSFHEMTWKEKIDTSSSVGWVIVNTLGPSCRNWLIKLLFFKMMWNFQNMSLL